MAKSNRQNLGITAIVIVIVAGCAYFRSTADEPKPLRVANSGSVAPLPQSDPGPASPLPRLVEIGGEKCIPCMEMAPIIEALKGEFAGKLVVEKIDLGTTPSAQKIYGIRTIPTQVFIQANGEEFWRHEGVLTRDDIVAKLSEMGVR